jgi:predicted nucleic acid-binding protein
MTTIVVDASVWVAAADPRDPFHELSRTFLRRLIAEHCPIVLPAFARVEIACALARRLHHPGRARALADALVAAPMVRVHPLDTAFLEATLECGTQQLLRAADALYVACAQRVNGMLVTWDEELRRRGRGLTPSEWANSGRC